MTEADWWACGDPRAMLAFVRDEASDRQLRLFACACSRTIWAASGGDTPEEIGVGERYADGVIGRRELRRYQSRLGALGGYSAAWAANNALHAVLDENARRSADGAVSAVANFAFYAALERTDGRPEDMERAAGARNHRLAGLSAVVRDIFGNPFALATIDGRWLTAPVLDLARTMYDARDFAGMPILADALEEAGCDNGEVLAHCRGPGTHVRGCWVVDLILGKA